MSRVVLYWFSALFCMIFLCNSDPAALHVLRSDEQNLRMQTIILIILIIQYAKKVAERPSPPITA